MKKAMLLAVAVLLFAVSASALPPVGYIGIYADAGHSINSYCPGPYGAFQAWIWCLPSVRGLQAAEFKVSFPASVLVSATVKNPGITVELGTLAGGISVAFGEGQCQLDWVYLYQLSCVVLSPTPLVQRIDIVPHPGTLPLPAYQFASCLPGYPIEACTYLTPLYLCQEGPVGVEETNWGAIKSLF